MKWRVIQEPLKRGMGEINHLHRYLKYEFNLKFSSSSSYPEIDRYPGRNRLSDAMRYAKLGVASFRAPSSVFILVVTDVFNIASHLLGKSGQVVCAAKLNTQH